MAFPRTGVWIRRTGSYRVAADPQVVIICNPGEEYQRYPLCSDGDRTDWFAVSPEQAAAIAHEHDPLAPERGNALFRFQMTHSEPAMYMRQRRLFDRLERGEIEPLEAEEAVLSLVGDVIAQAAALSRRARVGTKVATAARRDLVEEARADLVRGLSVAPDLTELAQRLETTPFHLCRVFRKSTGQSVHGYRLDLRLRTAIERLADPAIPLPQIATELGFSNRGHFTALFRDRYGMTPADYRRSLQRPTAMGSKTTP